MALYTEQDGLKFMERIAIALEKIAASYSTAYNTPQTPPTAKPSATHKRTAAIEVFEPVKEQS